MSGEALFHLRDLAQQNDSTLGTWFLRVNHVSMESWEWKQVRETGPFTFVSSPEIPCIELATMCYFGGGNTVTDEGKKRFGRLIERPRLVKLGIHAGEVSYSYIKAYVRKTSVNKTVNSMSTVLTSRYPLVFDST